MITFSLFTDTVHHVIIHIDPAAEARPINKSEDFKKKRGKAAL